MILEVGEGEADRHAEAHQRQHPAEEDAAIDGAVMARDQVRRQREVDGHECGQQHAERVRLYLGDGILQKANELSRSLPLGELDRAELQASGSRLVLRYESKRCLFVRTNTKARPALSDAAAVENAQDWLDRQPLTRGLLAASVLTNDGRICQRSFVRDFSSEVMHTTGREAARLLDITMKFMFPAWQVRLLYTRSQLYTFRRQDGVVLSAFLLRENNDLAGLHRFFDEFKLVRGVS